jgi:transcriptional regulator with XRE-family HTH domain
MDLNVILTQIRIARVSKGFKQEVLADKLGISQNHYSEIEKGKHKLTVEMLYKIGFALGVDYREFLPPPLH